MVTINSSFLTAQISETGAELTKLSSRTTDYLWDGNPLFWVDHSPILFPFVGRLPNKEYVFEGKTYGPVPLHGFAPKARFIVESWEENACTMLLVREPSMKEIYPFEFDFRVRYELEDRTLTVKYLVTNRGEGDMYYGLGGHPGFNVPLTDGIPFEDYYFEFPYAGDVKRRLFTDGVLDTEISEPYELDRNRFHLQHNLFDRDAVCLENTGYVAVLKTDKDKKSVRIEYPETRWCAFWHKIGAKAPYVCIEPWFTLPGTEGVNDIGTGKNSLHLCPGKSALHELIITVSE